MRAKTTRSPAASAPKCAGTTRRMLIPAPPFELQDHAERSAQLVDAHLLHPAPVHRAARRCHAASPELRLQGRRVDRQVSVEHGATTSVVRR